MQCGAVWCSVVQCVALWCSVVQRGALCCSVSQCGAVWCRAVHCGAWCCSVSAHTWRSSSFPACICDAYIHVNVYTYVMYVYMYMYTRVCTRIYICFPACGSVSRFVSIFAWFLYGSMSVACVRVFLH